MELPIKIRGIIDRQVAHTMILGEAPSCDKNLPFKMITEDQQTWQTAFYFPI